MKIYLDRDHNAVDFADKLYAALSQKYDITYIKSPTDMPYPEVAKAFAERIMRDASSRGILICKTGIGMSIVANKFKGVYANNCKSVEECYNFRTCNNGNVLTMGASSVPLDTAIAICETFLDTDFDVKHAGRIELIEKIT